MKWLQLQNYVPGHGAFCQQYLKRATRALHRGVKKASSMQARQRSLEAAMFRLSKESKQSDKSCSATHKPNQCSTHNKRHQAAWHLIATRHCWNLTVHRAHLLQRGSLWRWPSGAPSALAVPAPGSGPRPAPAEEVGRNEVPSASPCFQCFPGAVPSPTGSRTAPGLQKSSPGPPECETPPLPLCRRCPEGCSGSGCRGCRWCFWTASSGILCDWKRFTWIYLFFI